MQRAIVGNLAKPLTKTYLVCDVELIDRAWSAIAAQRPTRSSLPRSSHGLPLGGTAASARALGPLLAPARHALSRAVSDAAHHSLRSR